MATQTKKLPNIHPGEVLQEEFIKPLSLTQYRLAKDIRVPVTRIAEICRGRRSITADTALRLARYFGTSPKFWLGLQEDYDLEEGVRSKASEFDEIKPYAKPVTAAR
jgi:addiction module HigA family antidote